MSMWRRGPARRLRSAALIAALGLPLAGIACQEQPPAQPSRPILKIGTAFGPLTEPLTTEYRETLTNVDVQSVAAPNSIDVIHAIQNGTADFGVAYSNDTYAGYWAKEQAAGLNRAIRGVALLQPLSEYLLVRGNSGIHQVKDLRGRVVGVGPKDSSSAMVGRLILEAFDLNPVTIKVINTRAAAAEGLKDRTIDAVFLPGYVYPDEVMSAAIKDGAYFVAIAGPAVDRLRERNPFVRATTIPRNVIAGQTSLIPTVGVDLVVVCALDVDEALVYELTKQLFIAFPRLSGVEAGLRFLNVEEAAATPIPLHPGAARYFRERELSR
jgi:TRAP transporter TAXI family solute receptor